MLGIWALCLLSLLVASFSGVRSCNLGWPGAHNVAEDDGNHEPHAIVICHHAWLLLVSWLRTVPCLCSQWSLTEYVVCTLDSPGKVFANADTLGFSVKHLSDCSAIPKYFKCLRNLGSYPG